MLLKEVEVSAEAQHIKWAEPRPHAPAGAARPKPYDSSVKSAVRALEVIELFSLYRRPLSVNDVCHILEIPQSSASTLLKCLNRAGFIDRDQQSRCYRPGVRSAMLGTWAQAIHFNQGNMAQALDRLSERTGCGVRLAVRNRIFAQYVYVVTGGEASEPGRPRPGMLQPLCHDAIGEMLVIDLSDHEIRGIVHHTNAIGPRDRAPVDIKAFLERLKSSRAAGHAESWSLDSPNDRILAVLPPTGLGVPAVIGLSAPPRIFVDRRDAILREVRATLQDLKPSLS